MNNIEKLNNLIGEVKILRKKNKNKDIDFIINSVIKDLYDMKKSIKMDGFYDNDSVEFIIKMRKEDLKVFNDMKINKKRV